MEELKIIANAIGERLLAGKPSALEEAVDLYQKRIYNLAYRFTGDKEEAFDLSQEIFLRLHSRIKLFSSGTDFNAWFMRLAVNTSINYRAKTLRNPSRTALELCDEINPCTTDDEPDHLDKEAMNCSVNALLAQLPKKERMVIIFQLWEKKKVKEIALLMNLSVKSVEALLTRARKRLKKIVKKSEGF